MNFNGRQQTQIHGYHLVGSVSRGISLHQFSTTTEQAPPAFGDCVIHKKPIIIIYFGPDQKHIFFLAHGFVELVTIFGSEITFNWEELLFALVHSDNLSVKNKHLIGILTLAARKTITKKWLKPDVPSINEWYDIIDEMFVVEQTDSRSGPG